jgi:hypothetical protein
MNEILKPNWKEDLNGTKSQKHKHSITNQKLQGSYDELNTED